MCVCVCVCVCGRGGGVAGTETARGCISGYRDCPRLYQWLQRLPDAVSVVRLPEAVSVVRLPKAVSVVTETA